MRLGFHAVLEAVMVLTRAMPCLKLPPIWLYWPPTSRLPLCSARAFTEA